MTTQRLQKNDQLTDEKKKEYGVQTLEQAYGKGVVRAAARKRKKLGITSEGRHAGMGTYCALGVILLIFLFPLYYTVSIASQSSTSNQYGVAALKFDSGLWSNLLDAFTAIDFWTSLRGSLFVSLVTSVSTVFFSVLAGYSFAKLRFRGRNVLLTIVVGTMTIPQQLTVIPLYVLANKTGLYGSLWAVIIPSLISAFGVFWMTQYLQDALPYELIEAARVDGASMFRTFISVGVPAARPAAAMLFIFTFIGQWTNYFWPMLVMGSNKNATLTLSAATLKGMHFTDYTLVMSGVILTTMPLLIIFFFASKQLVSGIMAGAVKG